MVEINFPQDQQEPLLDRSNNNASAADWDLLQGNADNLHQDEVEEDIPVAAAITETVPIEQDPFYIDESSLNVPYMDQPNVQSSDDDDDDDKQIECASGVAAGLLGMLVAGPIIGLVTGFGSAYGTRKKGKAGDFARSIGKAGLSVQQQFETLDEQHQFRQATSNKWQEWSDRSPVISKTSEVVQTGWKNAAQFTKDHNLIERGIEGTGKGFEWVGRKIRGEPEPAPESPSVASE